MEFPNSVKRLQKRLALVPSPVWLALIVIGCLAPFCRHAFRIDDMLFLRAAEQIRHHPANFYGFTINWFGLPTPMPDAFENPPLTCYYIAFASLLVGWSEAALHLAFLVPAIAAAVGIHSLAKHFCQRPFVAAAASMLTPIFLVSAGTIMCDTMMLAFWVWSLVFFERGLKRNQVGEFWASGVLAGLAALTKFPGLALVPLLTVYGLVRTRRLGNWVVSLVVPVLFVAGYDLLTRDLYGRGLFSSSAAYTTITRTEVGQVGFGNLIVGLGFAGGCFLPLLFYAPGWWSRQIIGPGSMVVAVSVILPSVIARYRPLIHHADGSINPWVWGQISLMLMAGFYLVFLVGADAWQRRDAGSLLLGLWVAGIFLFTTEVNWMISGRSLLPMTGALGILVARRLDRATPAAAATPRFWPVWPAMAGAVLSLWVLKADCAIADVARLGATEACAQYLAPGRALVFQGHWGFQYYMEKLGAQPLDFSHPELQLGDVIVVPNHAANTKALHADAVAQIDMLEYAAPSAIATMNPSVGAGFYSSVIGPLPFVIGPAEPERFGIFQVRRLAQP